MKLPVQITFRNMESSDAIEAVIRKRVEKLETYYDQIMGCRVLIEVPNRHHLKGRHRHIRIDLTVPNAEIVVNHEPNLHAKQKQIEAEAHSKSVEVQSEYKDINVAIREAFEVAKRQLQNYARRRRLEIKQHSKPTIERQMEPETKIPKISGEV
jgi:ribosome-associated translation inhibitor RaiA